MEKAIKILCVIMSALMIIGAFAGCGEDTAENGEADNDYTYNSKSDNVSSEEETDTFHEVVFPEDFTTTAIAEIDIKNYGKITVGLDGNKAPITVKNFTDLAESGFYNGLTFHRIMEGFMMQGGDPEGTGQGGHRDDDGNEITIKGEFAQNGVNNSLTHTRGAISMARNSLSMDSASSQFFIVHKDSTFLDGQYAAFGYVTEGIEVVDKVCKAAKPTDDNGTIKKREQPIIKSVKIFYPTPKKD